MDTRIGRFFGLLLGIGLLIAAVVIFCHQRSGAIPKSFRVDSEAVREIYQNRMMQTRMFMSQIGDR